MLRLVEGERDQHRLEREELVRLEDVQLFPGKILIPQRLLRFEERQALLQDRQLTLHRLVVRAPELLVDLLDARFQHGHVGENELGLERGHVA